MKKHYLKTWQIYYERIAAGQKMFEVRRNDRDFQVGDMLILQEYLPEAKEYSGSDLVFMVGYILHGGQFGIEKDYCVLGLKEYVAK